MQGMRVVLIGLAFVALANNAAWAQERAQDYPSRQVNFIVPFAPGGGTDIIGQLHAATVKTVGSAELRAGFQKLGLEPVSSTPGEFGAFIRNEIAENAKLLQAIGDIKN